MLRKIGYIPVLRKQLTSPSSHGLNLVGLLDKLTLSGESCYMCGVKSFHSGETLYRDNKRNHERARDYKIQLALREEAAAVSIPHSRITQLFPDKNLPTKMFNGIMYKDIPIINIKVTPNNTILNLTDAKGIPKALRSCGMEGFKNARKGTNIAAQATAMTFSRRILDMGYKTVRVRIQGVGPGRTSSIRGLSLGGVDIVSVTDNTHVSDNPARGKKLRRI